ncbi:MAG: hypothetical protein KatS3mg055_3425 [Chloroflexus sp.]|nr:MAG: hypothetical protein KatS3mg055_3425 [Chloroflexus sp.]
MIAVQRTTTIRAGVPANGTSFGNGLATLRASLRRSGRVDVHHDSPSTRSLGEQDMQNDAPSGVVDRCGKAMVPYHPPNVQFFNRNMVILIDQCAGDCVGEIPSCSLDLQVGFRKQRACLAGAIAALHAASEPPLCLFQLTFGGAIVARVGNLYAVRQRCKRLKPNINSYRLTSWREW